MSTPLFFERQRGGLCRMHALNNFLGGATYNEESFAKLLAEYDMKYRDCHLPPAGEFDIFLSNSENVVVYALQEHENVYTKLFALGTSGLVDEIMEAIDPSVNALIIFNGSHIWTVKKSGDAWYELDSLRARPAQVASIKHHIAGYRSRRFGILVIRSRSTISKELYTLSAELRMIIHDKCELLDLLAFVVNEIHCHRLLTAVELPLSQFYELYTMVHGKCELFERWFIAFQQAPGDITNHISRLPPLLQFACRYNGERATEYQLRECSLVDVKIDGRDVTMLTRISGN